MKPRDLVTVKGEPGIWRIRTIHLALGAHHWEAGVDLIGDVKARASFMLVPVADLTPMLVVETGPET